MSMKAWVLGEIGKMEYQDVDVPMPKENEVRIQVKAAGICGSDIPRIYETGAHKMPLVCGHEFSGVVDEAGADVSSEWLGKRVAVYPKIPCGKCEQCRNGLPEYCQHYDYVGSRRDGAFAEYVSVPAVNLLALPDEVSFEQAAMLEPMGVATNAVRRACKGLQSELSLDEKVAVCGLGTIGLLVTMFLLEAGYREVYVVGNKDIQREKALLMGIAEDHFFDSRGVNVASRIVDATGGGVDCYFECVGKNETASLGLDVTAPGGRVILVGNPYSDMSFAKDTYWRILRNQIVVCGIWNASFSQEEEMDGVLQDDWHYVLDRLKGGRIHPEELITHRFSLEELEKGSVLMRDKVEEYVKVMVC